MIALHAITHGVVEQLVGVAQLKILEAGIATGGVVFQGDGQSVHGALHAVNVQVGAGVAGHNGGIAVGHGVVIARPGLNHVDALLGGVDAGFGDLGSIGVNEALLVPVSQGAITLHDLGILKHGAHLGGAVHTADHSGAVDEVEGSFHATGRAADPDGILILGQGGLPGLQEGSQLAPGADFVGNFEAQLSGLLGRIGDEVHRRVVLLNGDGVDRAIGSGGQIPNVLRHAGVQAGGHGLHSLGNIQEQALADALAGVVVPGAGEVDIIHFAGLDGGLQLVIGEILDVAFHADQFAAHFVELFQNHRVIDGSSATSAHGPGDLDGFFRAGNAHGEHQRQSEYQRYELLHVETLLIYLLQWQFLCHHNQSRMPERLIPLQRQW